MATLANYAQCSTSPYHLQFDNEQLSEHRRVLNLFGEYPSPLCLVDRDTSLPLEGEQGNEAPRLYSEMMTVLPTNQ